MHNCFIDIKTSLVDFTMPVQHLHAYYELYLLTEGERTLYIENDEYIMQKNQILLIPANIPHRTDGGYYTRYLVNFSEEYLDKSEYSVIDLFQRHQISITQEEANNLKKIINLMFKIQEDNSKSNKSTKDYNFNTLFRYLIFSLTQLTNYPTYKFIAKNQYNDRTKKIIDYIDKHFSENITLDLLCKIFYISKPALCSSFKKNTNMSIIDYLLKTRLKNAQNKLMYSNKSICDIAMSCGFSSQQYFYLIFKKHLKVSPQTFRKNNKIYIEQKNK